MLLVQDQIRRILERLAKLRGRYAAPSQSSLVHLAGALEDVIRIPGDGLGLRIPGLLGSR